MKRAAALASLSRDHHHALVVAQALWRVTPESTEEARSALLAYWPRHGRVHFELEEQVLLPAFAGHGDAHHPLVARAVCDHREIRHRIYALQDYETPAVAELRELGRHMPTTSA